MRPAMVELYKDMIMSRDEDDEDRDVDFEDRNTCTPSEVLSWRVGQSFYAKMNPERGRATRAGYREARCVAQLRTDIHELIEAADAEGTDCEGVLKGLQASGDEEQLAYYRKVVDDFGSSCRSKPWKIRES